jgi:hypothetical protein
LKDPAKIINGIKITIGRIILHFREKTFGVGGTTNVGVGPVGVRPTGVTTVFQDLGHIQYG